MSPESQASLDPSWFCSRSPRSSFHGLVLLPGISWPFLCFGLLVSSFLHLFWSSLVFLFVFLPLVLSVFPVYVVVSPGLLGFPWFSWSFFPGLSWSLLVLLIFSWSILVMLVSLVSPGHAYIFPVYAGLPWSCWSFLVCLVLSGPFWSFLV